MVDTKDSAKIEEIKVQMEYYLSDENLKKDHFFHEKISSDPEGFVDIDLFLKCNKIIKAGWSLEDLIKGIQLSDLIEVCGKANRVRRKENKVLPELTLLNKKRKKDDDGQQDENKPEIEPIILQVNTDKDVTTRWKDILNEFKEKNPSLNVVYSRFKGNEGNFGILIANEDDLKFTESFDVEGNTFKVQKCEGDSLIDFWKNHGSHYQLCTKQTKQPRMNKKEKKIANSTYLEKPVELGGETFTDLSLIRSKARNILTNSKDDEPLKDNDHKFVFDLLKFHHNYVAKIKDIDFITTGKPEQFDYSRCFFVMKKDKSKDDFSIQKCIEILESKHKKI